MKFTTSGGSGTVGHGLSSAPEVVLMKRTNTTSDWYFFTTAVDGSMDLLRLNTTAAQTADTSQALPTTTFKDWASSGDWIAYCFHSVSGYSKIGTYQGNSSNSNTIVTGFRPAWILIKNPNTTDGWYILDNKRKNGVYTNVLYPHLTNSELASSGGNGEYSITFLQNGFELTEITAGYNQSSNTYLYFAISE